MKTVYTSVMNRLESEVPSLSWIELNVGQLKQIDKGEILPMTYPCALIGISIPECADITDKTQDCKAVVDIMLLFDPIQAGETASNLPEDERNNALKPYNVISDVYRVLQGFETDHFNALSRTSQGEEYSETLFVYKLNFRCDFIDITAE